MITTPRGGRFKSVSVILRKRLGLSLTFALCDSNDGDCMAGTSRLLCRRFSIRRPIGYASKRYDRDG